MKNPESDFTQVLSRYAEEIIARLTDLQRTMEEVQKDIHIQVLSANAKIEHTNRLTNSLLNGFSEKLNDLVKTLEAIKKSAR